MGGPVFPPVSHIGSGALVPAAGLEKVEKGRAAFLEALPLVFLGSQTWD